MPSEHWIEDTSSFAETVRCPTKIFAAERWITFGIPITEPTTGYGYIEAADWNENMAGLVSFIEKPKCSVAEQYLG